MSADDPERVWAEYYAHNRAQHVSEAAVLWRNAEAAGVNEHTVLALDFLAIASAEPNAQALARLLSEKYTVEVVPATERGYWHVKGTTRPYGVSLTGPQHSDWVEYMSDVAQSNACVLTTWAIEAPALKMQLRSEDVDIEGSKR